ncbi:MAG: hypothetical protein Q8942_18680, partial [Bacillota bacterium]|nr:hypothetical protein [Bacillota bacterium]
MNISKKCLYPMCNKHEDACKNDFKSCNDCAYLYKPGIASLFGNINKTGIYVLLISILVIAGFVVTKAVFRNHNEPSSSSAANKISSPAEETNKKIPGAS